MPGATQGAKYSLGELKLPRAAWVSLGPNPFFLMSTYPPDWAVNHFIVCSFVFVCYWCLSCDHFWYRSLPTWHRKWYPDPMAENLDENLDDKVCILYIYIYIFKFFFSADLNCLWQIGEEALKIYLEEEDSLTEHIDALIAKSLEDFPDDDTSDSAARHAAEITRASITDGTRGGHIR